MPDVQLSMFDGMKVTNTEPMPCYHCRAMPTIVKVRDDSWDMFCGKCRYQGMYNMPNKAKMIRKWNETQKAMRFSCMAYGRGREEWV